MNRTDLSGDEVCILSTSLNATAQSKEDCELYLKSFIVPTTEEWILIFIYICTFIIGLIGNALVCFAIIRNKNMRTTTNMFIMNLSVADLVTIFICLPLALVVDVTQTWFFGTIACCIFLFLNTFSINVSVLTLCAISIERWYAICHPLRFHSTMRRTKNIILFIWIISACASLPMTVTSSSKRYISHTVYFASCYPSRLSPTSLMIYQLCFIIGMYVIPLGLMAFAYIRIALVLWNTQVPHESVSRSRQPMLNSNRQNEDDTQTESRRKVARMLIAVVTVFAICYLPNHLLNIFSFTGVFNNDSSNQTLTICAMTAHWLVWFNSCINPIIYNFMSGKFRKEFKDAVMNCVCCVCWNKQNGAWHDNYRVNFNAEQYRVISTRTGHSNILNKGRESSTNQIEIGQI